MHAFQCRVNTIAVSGHHVSQILAVTKLHMHSASSGAEVWLAGCGCVKGVQVLAAVLE